MNERKQRPAPTLTPKQTDVFLHVFLNIWGSTNAYRGIVADALIDYLFLLSVRLGKTEGAWSSIMGDMVRAKLIRRRSSPYDCRLTPEGRPRAAAAKLPAHVSAYFAGFNAKGETTGGRGTQQYIWRIVRAIEDLPVIGENFPGPIPRRLADALVRRFNKRIESIEQR